MDSFKALRQMAIRNLCVTTMRRWTEYKRKILTRVLPIFEKEVAHKQHQKAEDVLLKRAWVCVNDKRRFIRTATEKDMHNVNFVCLFSFCFFYFFVLNFIPLGTFIKNIIVFFFYWSFCKHPLVFGRACELWLGWNMLWRHPAEAAAKQSQTKSW